tara:strand:+ start:860 stop:1867 length:1008 start_codon:yes stop_codon:yes gene_type:complete
MRFWKDTEHTLSSNAAMWGGIAFSLVFVGVIHFARPFLPTIEFAPDTGASHYFWKLPDPTALTRAIAWISYLAHQGVIWFLIWKAQRDKLSYSGGLHRVNILAFATNAGFVVWHMIQTLFWYDGLAQDVSVWSSQWSVIIMLVLILHMENQRRGVFFGKKVPFLSETGGFIRKYHGYVFSWAIVYTFWFHPMENTPGHLIGFFYMFMLMVQGSLFFTRAHLNRYWTFTLEILVLFHGTLVAINQGNGMWPMFCFGFAGLFIITQMHGLGLNLWQRWGFFGVYLGGALWIYGPDNLADLHQLTWIPLTEYTAMFVLAGFTWVGMKLTGRGGFAEYR